MRGHLITIAVSVLLAGCSSTPTAIDTDGDGLSDDAERLHGLNPMSRDSDGDCIDDRADAEPLVHAGGTHVLDERSAAVIGSEDLPGYSHATQVRSLGAPFDCNGPWNVDITHGGPIEIQVWNQSRWLLTTTIQVRNVGILDDPEALVNAVNLVPPERSLTTMPLVIETTWPTAQQTPDSLGRVSYVANSVLFVPENAPPTDWTVRSALTFPASWAPIHLTVINLEARLFTAGEGMASNPARFFFVNFDELRASGIGGLGFSGSVGRLAALDVHGIIDAYVVPRNDTYLLMGTDSWRSAPITVQVAEDAAYDIIAHTGEGAAHLDLPDLQWLEGSNGKGRIHARTIDFDDFERQVGMDLSTAGEHVTVSGVADPLADAPRI